eukprot:12534084-Ditylum_brightwellii.AAC.1
MLVLKSPKEVLQEAGLRTALQDIQTEIKIMLQIQYKHGGHHHILHFYGVVTGQHEGNSNDDGDFEQDKDHWLTSSLPQMPPRQSIILIQLNGTLTNYMNKWRDERGIGVFKLFDMVSTKDLWLQCLIVMTKVVSAIHFFAITWYYLQRFKIC